MNSLQLFLPCAAGVEDLLAQEVHRLTGLAGDDLMVARAGVFARASWRDAMQLNLQHSGSIMRRAASTASQTGLHRQMGSAQSGCALQQLTAGHGRTHGDTFLLRTT